MTSITAYLSRRDWRILAATMAMVGVLGPWLKMDGNADYHSGAELIAFLLAGEGAERWWMLRRSIAGAMALHTLPVIAASLVSIGAVREYFRKPGIYWHTAAIICIAPLLASAGPVTSSQQPAVGVFIIPGWGLALTLLATTVLAGEQAGRTIRDGRRQRRAATPALET